MLAGMPDRAGAVRHLAASGRLVVPLVPALVLTAALAGFAFLVRDQLSPSTHDMSVPPAETGGTLAKVSNERIPTMGLNIIFGMIGSGGGLLVEAAKAVGGYPLPGQILIGAVLGLAAISFVGQFFSKEDQ